MNGHYFSSVISWQIRFWRKQEFSRAALGGGALHVDKVGQSNFRMWKCDRRSPFLPWSLYISELCFTISKLSLSFWAETRAARFYSRLVFAVALSNKHTYVVYGGPCTAARVGERIRIRRLASLGARGTFWRAIIGLHFQIPFIRS